MPSALPSLCVIPLLLSVIIATFFIDKLPPIDRLLFNINTLSKKSKQGKLLDKADLNRL